MDMLLIRPVPLFQESLLQYACRLARVNHYSYGELMKLIRSLSDVPLEYSASGRKNFRNLIIQLTGHNEVEELLDPHFFNWKFPIVFDLSRTKICTFCLIEDDRAYYNWHYRHNLICNIHQVFLIDRCRFCSKIFSNSVLISKRCSSCKASLSVSDSHISYTMTFKIDKYFLSLDSFGLVNSKINELEPYFEILKDGSFAALWKKNQYHIHDQVFFLNTVIAFYFDKILIEQHVETLIFNSESEQLPDVLPKKIKHYLNPDKFIIFTRRVQALLLKLSDKAPDFQVRLEWFEKIFQIKYSAHFYVYNGFCPVISKENATISLLNMKRVINGDTLY